MDNIETIFSALNEINNKIYNTKNISTDDLKLLLLITFNECLATNDSDPIIKSYLTVTIKNFIDLENEYQLILQEQNKLTKTEEEIIEKILHHKITGK